MYCTSNPFSTQTILDNIPINLHPVPAPQQDSTYYKLLNDSTSTKPSASWVQPQPNISLPTASETKTDILGSRSNKNKRKVPKSIVSTKYSKARKPASHYLEVSTDKQQDKGQHKDQER